MRPLPFFIISCFVLTQSFQEKASGQIYHIESSDGKLVKIRLRYEPYNGSLIISSSKDSFILPDLLDTFEVSHLSKRFLEIKYAVDGGTGVLLKRTVIISALKSKQIVPSLIITSGLHVLSFDTKRLQTVNFHLSKQDTESCELGLILHDKQISPHDRKENFDTTELVVLKFNRPLGIFFSGEQHLSQEFTVIHPLDKSKTKKHVNGNFPTIKIGLDQYYYLDPSWYERIDSNHLLEQAERSNEYSRRFIH
jgi:hypothetical protein